jgi:hypothetical protein
VDTDSSIERPFSRRLVPGDQNRKFDTVILISHEDPEKLPSSFSGREYYNPFFEIVVTDEDLKLGSTNSAQYNQI